MRSLGLVDGKIVELDANVVNMEDRGYQFGDGIYEYTKVYNSKYFAFQLHMDRLFRSLKELRIPATYTLEQFADFHKLLIKETGIPYGGIYLQITRGTAPRDHHFPKEVVPKLTMSFRPGHLEVLQPLWENGTKVITVPDERWFRCDIKSLNLLGNVLAKQKAKENDCYEAVQIRDGFITEGSSSNFSVVKDGVIWTYPICNLILKGVTRTIMVETLAPAMNVSVTEKPFTADFAKGADEAFLTGTSTEFMPVTLIDGVKVGDGKVGPITRKLQKAYSALIDKECER